MSDQEFKRKIHGIPDEVAWDSERERYAKAWDEADVILRRPPRRLTKFMIDRCGTRSPVRYKLRNVLDKEIGRSAWKEELNNWRQEVADLVRGFGRATTPVAKELAWRMLEEAMPILIAKWDEEKRLAMGNPTGVVTTEGMEFLPTWLRWVVNHPALPFPYTKMEELPDTQKQAMEYERLYPCPNSASRNYFLTIRGDKKEVAMLFKEVLRRQYANMKKDEPIEEGKEAEMTEDEVRDHLLSLKEG